MIKIITVKFGLQNFKMFYYLTIPCNSYNIYLVIIDNK